MELTASSTPGKRKQFSPMLHSWKWNVRSNRKMMIILTVLHMIAAPAVLFSELAGIFSGKGIGYSDGIYMVIGVLTTLAAGFMGIIIAVGSFNCLHKKSVVDMKLSLPMTADQRFISDFMSGLFVYMAPFLAAQAVALLLSVFGLVFLEGRTLYRQSYSGFGSTPYVCDYFTDATIALLKLILCGILTMLMLYTLTVLITVCCGSRFECIAYSIGVNVVIPVTILMVTISMFDDIFGIDPERNAFRVFMVTSPAGGIFTAVEWAFEGTDYISDYMDPAVWAVLFFFLTALVGAFAFFLYRKRRAEQVSKPFVFKLVYYIIITGVIFCICSLCYMADSFIPAIIVTAVVYMIAEVIANRGFKSFKSGVIRYIATVAAAFFIVFMGQSTDGFGALNRIPSIMTVASAEISYSGIYGDFMRPGDNTIVLKNRDNIKAVTDAHRSILEEHERRLRSKDHYSGTGDASFWHFYRMTIKYRLIGGGVIEREYDDYYFTSDVIGILSVIDYSDEYKKQLVGYYTDKMHSWEERCIDIIERPAYYGIYPDNHTAGFDRRERSSGKADWQQEVSMQYLYENNFFERFAEAYSSDIMAMDKSNYSLSDSVDRYTVYTVSNHTELIYIPNSFKNTIRLLEEYGFEIP